MGLCTDLKCILHGFHFDSELILYWFSMDSALESARVLHDFFFDSECVLHTCYLGAELFLTEINNFDSL